MVITYVLNGFKRNEFPIQFLPDQFNYRSASSRWQIQ